MAIADPGRVLVIGHRGASAIAPENTLPAFEKAIESDADGFELDYRRSAGGDTIVFHDETLDRTTDVRQRWGIESVAVASKTLAELNQLDAGAWFHPAFAGTRIPTLEQALDAIPAGKFAMLERKEGNASALFDALRRTHAHDRVVLMSFDWQFLGEVVRLESILTVGAIGEGPVDSGRIGEICALGTRYVAWNCRDLDAGSVERLLARQLAVWSWTVDDPNRANQLIQWGVTGIITNDPGRIHASIGSKR